MNAPAQSKLFSVTSSSPLIGVVVELDRAVDKNKPCCRSIAVIAAGRGPHPASLTCVDCGRFRGWLSKATVAKLLEVIRLFGVPDEPLVVRDASHHFTEGR
jgi:hypothetical protein